MDIKLNKEKYEIAYVCSTLKRVGPSNQTLNIIKYSPYKKNSIVITLFKENENDTLIEEYKKEKIEIVCLNLSKKNIFLWKSKLRKILKMTNAKLVHSYGIIPDSITRKASKNICKHIITLRNFPKEDIFTRMSYWKACIAYMIHIRALKKSNNVISCSNTIKEKMVETYKKENIVAIQNGVDVSRFNRTNNEIKNKLREKYGIKDKIVFISTSSFIPRKRIEETVQAFLQADIKNGLLLMLGDGMLYEKIFNKYKENKNIKFIGKSNKVSEYLQLSDIFLSTSESEGLPNGVLEAIATGLPVVISDIPQHKEILNELGNVGETYKLGDIDNLTQILKEYKKVLQQNDKDYITKSALNMKNMSGKYVKYYEKYLR